MIELHIHIGAQEVLAFIIGSVVGLFIWCSYKIMRR